jgi:D-serine deaminase-like pyridoxal phosphate-dependent protein
MGAVRVRDLPTPAVVVDATAVDHNLAAMAAVLPGARLRPHVKAHKSTALAARQAAAGHRGFTCATPREVLGMAAAGLGDDLLLANESLDGARLAAMARCGARVTVAVDSPETVAAAAAAGIGEVLVDVDVGLPRCGIAPDRAGALAGLARSQGLIVRGVMGYEGHLMMVGDRAERQARVAKAMAMLAAAHAEVGGDVVSAGGTGTFDLALGTAVTEVQAGSYVLMDTQYATLGLPFRPALAIVATVIHARDAWAVADAGLKALGMDHGNPDVVLDDATPTQVWFCSDEHVTVAPPPGAPPLGLRPGDRVWVHPAHLDPTLALHERMYVADGPGLDATVVDTWAVDLRGW